MSFERITWKRYAGLVRENNLGEYPDLSFDLDSGVIPELVERLCVVGVKPHSVCLPI